MVDICEGALATGEDAFHPGESILAAGESFQELDDESRVDDVDEQGNEPAVSDEEVCPLLLSSHMQQMHPY